MNSPKLTLELRAQQKLVMTPALQQAISLLQMNNLELAALLNQEMEQNPLLDLVEPDDAARTEEPHAETAAAKDLAEAIGEQKLLGEGEAILDMGDGDNAGGARESDYESGINSWSEVMASGGTAGLDDDPLRNTQDRPTLQDHLLAQIHMDFTGQDRAVAALLCDHLDEAGYLRADLIALADQWGLDLEYLLLLVGRVQQLDPPGIFARDLAECLELQLADRGALSLPMAKLLANLDLLGRHELDKLEKKCGVDRDALADLIKLVKSCDPKPAAAFDHVAPATLIPDVLMRSVRDPESGQMDWELELNPETLPRALVKEKYFTRVMAGARDNQTKQFLKDRHQAAHWLVRALQSRAETILKVARAIVKTQSGFFQEGVAALKPLTLKDIAADVAMHESTISRVTAGKYMATPRGMFELKYFFNAALSSAHGGEDVASEAVRVRIKQLIDGEKPNDILSDDRLALMLQAEGVMAARRTVAKYREAMNIPGSFYRKRMAKALA